MINISTSSKLDIILPNINRALAQVLQDSTQKELETLSQGKDLKSLLNSILKQSAKNPSADKELLQLVKNNPTLKNLGSVSTTINEILNSIKDDKNPLPAEKILKDFLIDVKDLKGSALKQKLENSGIFLESKLKNVTNPQNELKNRLTSLVNILQSSSETSAKSIAKQSIEILKGELLQVASKTDLTQNTKENPKALQSLSSSVQSIISELKGSLKATDVIYGQDFLKTFDKLQQQLTPKMLTAENFNLSSLKESLEQLLTSMNRSFTLESKGVINTLEKIFLALNGVKTTQELTNKNILKDINNLNQSIKDIIQKADPMFSKDVSYILEKLQSLNTPDKLQTHNGVREILTNDLKAVLLQTAQDLSKSSHSNQNELLKNIDKLSLQIDHYQLLSHLSNNSLLYLPFSWEMLQEGHIEFKRAEDEKFLCDIDLKLQEYGKINLKLTLFEKNQLNLHIYSSNEEFKELVKEHIPSLRSGLIEAEITPREIRVFEPKKQVSQLPYQEQSDNLQMGFEVKA